MIVCLQLRQLRKLIKCATLNAPCALVVSYAAEDGVAIATATFRVKLNRLLAHSRLGEIQAQASSPFSYAAINSTGCDGFF